VSDARRLRLPPLVLLLVYSIGLGIPFVLVAVGATAVNARLVWFRKHEAAVSLVTEAMLIGVGFLMITNLFLKLPGFVPSFVI
jgi:cytochrome c-type biogenesis protein